MILRFETEIGYKNPQNVLIFSKNFALAMKDPFIIDNKLTKVIQLCWVVLIPIPIAPFILSPIGLVLKYNGGFKQIYHLLHPKEKSINDHILNREGKLRYTQFQNVLDLIFKAG